MKRGFVLLLSGTFFIGISGGKVSAADFPKEEEQLEAEEMRPGHEVYLKNRADHLERRVAWLEEEIRLLKEKTRNFERRIDDLRQRHV